MDPLPGTAAFIEFGRFTLLPYRRELLADGQPIELGGRAFDVLLTLIDAPGAVLTKDQLMGRVWPMQSRRRAQPIIPLRCVGYC